MAARNRRRGVVYAVTMHVALGMTLLSYATVYLHSRAPPAKKEPPKEVLERRVVRGATVWLTSTVSSC